MRLPCPRTLPEASARSEKESSDDGPRTHSAAVNRCLHRGFKLGVASGQTTDRRWAPCLSGSSCDRRADVMSYWRAVEFGDMHHIIEVTLKLSDERPELPSCQEAQEMGGQDGRQKASE